MRRKEKRYTLMSLAVFTALSMGSMYASANDDDSGDADAGTLAGDYGFTTTLTCVRTPFQRPPAAGFDPSTHRLLVDGEVINAVGSGIMRFAKDGAVSIEDGVLTEILANQISAGQIPVAPRTEFTCSGSYIVQPTSRVAATLSCNALVDQPGVSVTLAPFEFEGFVGRGKRSISLSSVTGSTQTVSVSVARDVVEQRERICIQSLTLDKL
jgi:hypothetical protein